MQKRYIKYKDNLVSFDTNASKSGIIPGALYRGFDTITGGGDLNFTVSHELTGEIQPDVNEDDSAPMGIWMSRQGTTIKEDEPIALAIQTNSGNSFPRKDYVIGHHHHDILSPGGLAATYDVIRGPLNSLDLPSDPEGNDWIILAILLIPAQADDTSQMGIRRPKIPSLGNKFPALLEESNRFEEQQQEFQGGTKTIASALIDGIAARYSLGDIDGANLMRVSGAATLDLIPDKPDGTEIELFFNQETTLRPFVSQLTVDNITAGFSKGLRAIVINSDTADSLIIKINQIATFRKFNKGGVYAGDNKIFGEYWKLISVSDSPDKIRQHDSALTTLNTALTTLQTQLSDLLSYVNGLEGEGTIRAVKIFGNVLDFFNLLGRGKPDTIYSKHQWCNGLLGTPDLRGVKLSGFAGTLDTYNNGLLSGSNSVTLVEENLPKIQPKFHGSNLPKPSDGGTPSNRYIKPLRTDGQLGDDVTPIEPFGGEIDGSTRAFDITGRIYQTIFIMRLQDSVIADNPYEA